MRPVLLGLAVVAALGMSSIPANADDHCGDGLFQTRCPSELELAERAEEEAYYDHLNDLAEQDYKERLYYAAEQADAWVNTYLAAEKAVAIYWRSAYVRRDSATGKRMGTLDGVNTSEEVRYPCDPNYDVALSGGCVPADRDYDCWELRSWGIVNIPIMDTSVPTVNGAPLPSFLGDDWMLLDDDLDGIGCEV